jgi:hypothetical protein
LAGGHLVTAVHFTLLDVYTELTTGAGGEFERPETRRRVEARAAKRMMREEREGGEDICMDGRR